MVITHLHHELRYDLFFVLTQIVWAFLGSFYEKNYKKNKRENFKVRIKRIIFGMNEETLASILISKNLMLYLEIEEKWPLKLISNSEKYCSEERDLNFKTVRRKCLLSKFFKIQTKFFVSCQMSNDILSNGSITSGLIIVRIFS